MKKSLSLFVALIAMLLASGCAGVMPVEQDSQREFTYDYKIEGQSKDELWNRAKFYFIDAYGDSRAVFRDLDKEGGTIIGRGSVTWSLLGEMCGSDYHVRFAAKDYKARLQLEIIEGVPAYSNCRGWPWPSTGGYNKIVKDFEEISIDLGKSLRGGGVTSTLKDF